MTLQPHPFFSFLSAYAEGDGFPRICQQLPQPENRFRDHAAVWALIRCLHETAFAARAKQDIHITRLFGQKIDKL